MKNKLRIPTSRLLAIFCSLATIAHAGFAQNEEPVSEEVIELSEFVVKTDTTDSYIASEAITGSRVAVAIKDLTFPVQVMTREFMEDFAIFEFDEMGYTSSLTDVSETGGEYNLRGYGAPRSLYNGFFRIGLIDRVNIDRVEVIKGPSAAIYGETSPGGLMNFISSRPKNRPEQKLSLSYGDYATIRGEVSSTGQIGSLKDTTYLVTAAYSEREYDSLYHYKQMRNVGGVLNQRINDKSSVQVEFSWTRRDENPYNRIPYIYDSKTKRYTALADELRNFNHNGPDSKKVSEMYTGNAVYENRLSKAWSMRVAANWYERTMTSFSTNSAARFNAVDRELINRRPNYSETNEDGFGAQVDFSARYFFFDGAVESRTLFTLDASQYVKYNLTLYPSKDITDDENYYVKNLNVDNPDYRVPAFSRDTYTEYNRENDNSVDVLGGFIRQQTVFMNGRLITVAGLRYDYVTFDLNDILTGERAKYNDDELNPLVGLNFKIVPTVAFYLNWSNSFTPQAQSATAEDRLPNEEATGWDFGFKASVLDDRLVFTLGGFDIARDGVQTTLQDEFGDEYEAAAGSETAKGIEFDFTWHMSESLTLLGGFGYVDSVTSENGIDLDSVGRWTRGVPHVNGGIALRYKTPIRGLSLNLGVKHVGKFYTDPTAGGIKDGDGFIRSHDGRRDMSFPSYTLVDAGIGYSFPARKGESRHSLRLNVKNLLDEEYITTSRKAGDRRGFYLTYSLRL